MEEILLFYLLFVLGEEGQLFEVFLEFYEEFEDARFDDIVLEETTDVEALLVKDEVDKCDMAHDILLPPGQRHKAVF